MKRLSTASVAVTLVTQFALFAATPVASADIFTWEYINPWRPCDSANFGSTNFTPRSSIRLRAIRAEIFRE